MALDGSMVVAANNAGTAYVWRMLRGASVTTHFEPLHKLRAHQGGSLMSKSSCSTCFKPAFRQRHHPPQAAAKAVVHSLSRNLDKECTAERT